ncbi:steroid Delta-isomerase [Streptomyces spiroverticillatus]|uniref:Steroid Delta-isomerase n=1 Tax=Streptomyces finlayi TaxID=67296 RepID=A0A918WWN4_9ACTN|nr:nuclear transport factor 2 family protein [Streptomyces finlayi]GHA05618.1 steroid Delta-isomerase [Streptomyces spiroverticillatus]GHC89446.1 steroid Delta-isomerase [Streptomyces finlayi]
MNAPSAVVDRQLAAYNSHDIDAFTATYAEEVVIHRRDGSELRGRQELREAYTAVFAEGRCRAEISGRLTEGDWVVDHEIAHGLRDEPVRVLVVYRVREGLIDRVEFHG